MSQQKLEKDASNELYELIEQLDTKYHFYVEGDLIQLKQELLEANLTVSESKELTKEIIALDKLQLPPIMFERGLNQLYDSNPKIVSVFYDLEQRKLKDASNASNELYELIKQVNTKYKFYNETQISELEQEIPEANLTTSESKELIQKIIDLDKLELTPNEFRNRILYQILDGNSKLYYVLNAKDHLELFYIVLIGGIAATLHFLLQHHVETDNEGEHDSAEKHQISAAARERQRDVERDSAERHQISAAARERQRNVERDSAARHQLSAAARERQRDVERDSAARHQLSATARERQRDVERDSAARHQLSATARMKTKQEEVTVQPNNGNNNNSNSNSNSNSNHHNSNSNHHNSNSNHHNSNSNHHNSNSNYHNSNSNYHNSNSNHHNSNSNHHNSNSNHHNNRR